MTTVLHINASGTRTGSVSRAATNTLLQELAPTNVITRDLAETPLPQIDDTWITTRLIPDADLTDADRDVLSLSDALIDEIKAADVILIGMPMYNFGMPAALKAWVDLIARPKVTFAYTENGPVGLLEGKKAIVTVASGGVPVGAPMDFATPHIEQILKFIGITDITVHTAKDVVAKDAA
ncbi:FMN-dependent NADH-azoreductase [Roseobacter sp. CCS2]|uniref:FMN-dependent NADH-azoreductase n=1 Tax=Roseobacter sp. CCS2 TaxID=391593 RepID=UPI0000F3E5C7|nr:NAD(P)H-dependent oxidoreductase [Roseobacter sp. CCS2]EBA12351.1 (Acyl-carrier protein) phosphodiesterase [Roseobacter sp. CCS2]